MGEEIKGFHPHWTSQNESKPILIATATESESQEPMLNLHAVAAILKIGYMTAWKLVRSGSIPSYRIGGHYRVALSGLNLYLASARATESH